MRKLGTDEGIVENGDVTLPLDAEIPGEAQADVFLPELIPSELTRY